MNLRDYLSNSPYVNRRIPEVDRATSTEVKVLGVLWNSIQDTISLKCYEKQFDKTSKRTVLSQINGFCYDPLGLLSPLMTPAKVFLQDLHKQKYGWDAPLSSQDQKSWEVIKHDISGFQITLPRKVVEKSSTAAKTLSIFVDSSKRAYACCRYVTSTLSKGTTESRLFTAKSKIAPINKKQTIPRLELLSIFTGLSFAESAIQKTSMDFEQINLFSDSTIALCWIQGTRRLPSIVTTLVQKIRLITKRLQEGSNVSFFHVPTDENVADCATRGVTKENFVNHRWWCGPLWLNRPMCNWPVKKAEDLCEQTFTGDEICSVATGSIEATEIWPVEKISNYSKLIRIVAYCARFIRKASKGKCLPLKKSGATNATTAEEAVMAEKLIIRQEQAIYNSTLLTQNKQLNVKADNDGIFRKFSRLENSELSFSAANPVHIPKQSKLGDSIAAHLHR
ncbi:Pao retrotransposon peptidase, partial [Trichostrongylus colubriformis]